MTIEMYTEGGEDYGARNTSERVLTFSMIRNKLMMRLKQYVRRPKATRKISATWSSHISWPTAGDVPNEWGRGR